MACKACHPSLLRAPRWSSDDTPCDRRRPEDNPGDVFRITGHAEAAVVSSDVMGVPQTRWMDKGKSYENSWWLGVPLFQETTILMYHDEICAYLCHPYPSWLILERESHRCFFLCLDMVWTRANLQLNQENNKWSRSQLLQASLNIRQTKDF